MQLPWQSHRVIAQRTTGFSGPHPDCFVRVHFPMYTSLNYSSSLHCVGAAFYMNAHVVAFG